MKKEIFLFMLLLALCSCNNNTKQPYHKVVNFDSIYLDSKEPDFLYIKRNMLYGLTDRQIKKLYGNPTHCYKQTIEDEYAFRSEDEFLTDSFSKDQYPIKLKTCWWEMENDMCLYVIFYKESREYTLLYSSYLTTEMIFFLE